jgi:protein-S-isoprenylcysteine O-methyltransferase Ste14
MRILRKFIAKMNSDHSCQSTITKIGPTGPKASSMSIQTPISRRWLGSLLVSLQFVALLGLALLNLPILRGTPIPTGALVVALAGMGLGFWSLVANQPGNFNIRPHPREDGQLISRDPYRWIRHPIYTSVLAWGAACACGSASPWGWLAMVVLLIALITKARLEECWMT